MSASLRRLFVDVTRTVESGLHTGIQRVVRQLVKALCAAGDAEGVQVYAMMFEGERWFALDALAPHPLDAAGQGPDLGMAQFQPSRPPARTCIEPGAGDLIFMADASWYLDPWPAVDAALRRRAVLVGFVHDIFPITHPQWFRPELAPRFTWHLHALVRRASLLVTPTRVVECALRAHLAAAQMAVPPTTAQGLGADFLPDAARLSVLAPGDLSLEADAFVLLVGTIEPRKNHRTVLKAFELLWAQGQTMPLVLVGAAGWNSDALLQRIQQHPELGSRLHWLRQLDDLGLGRLYGQARALVFASLDEGFGLPLVEAAHLGCPVLASDIEVLREVGGRWPRYLPALDVPSWQQAIGQLGPRSRRTAAVRQWSQVGQQLFLSLKTLSHGVAAVSAPTPHTSL